MIKLTYSAATAALSVGLAACGGSRAVSHASASELQNSESYVVVSNQNFLDVNIYAVRNGTRFRIGTVRGLSTDTLALRRGIIGAATSIQLLVDPIGGNNVHLTDPIVLGPDRWVDFTVGSPLNFSHFSIWPAAHRR